MVNLPNKCDSFNDLVQFAAGRSYLLNCLRCPKNNLEFTPAIGDKVELDAGQFGHPPWFVVFSDKSALWVKDRDNIEFYKSFADVNINEIGNDIPKKIINQLLDKQLTQKETEFMNDIDGNALDILSSNMNNYDQIADNLVSLWKTSQKRNQVIAYLAELNSLVAIQVVESIREVFTVAELSDFFDEIEAFSSGYKTITEVMESNY